MRATHPTLVIGAGGHAKVVVAALVELGVEIAAILDDDPDRWDGNLLGLPVSGPIADHAGSGEPAILAIGDNAIRRRLGSRLDCAWRSVVHPSAWVHASARIGPGTFVAAGAVIQPDTRIGAHAIVNTAATVDHDCVIGPHAHLAPGSRLAGEVTVGEGALVGIGASVAPGLRIGEWSVLGAGAAAVTDIADHAVAVGVPARVRGDG